MSRMLRSFCSTTTMSENFLRWAKLIFDLFSFRENLILWSKNFRGFSRIFATSCESFVKNKFKRSSTIMSENCLMQKLSTGHLPDAQILLDACVFLNIKAKYCFVDWYSTQREIGLQSRFKYLMTSFSLVLKLHLNLIIKYLHNFWSH